MVKFGDHIYDGEISFDAIKAIFIRDNQVNITRYSFSLHFDENNNDSKNTAIISWVEHCICELFKCKSSRDCDPGNIIFYDFTQSDADVWDQLDTIDGRHKLIMFGIDIINITNRTYNFTK